MPHCSSSDASSPSPATEAQTPSSAAAPQGSLRERAAAKGLFYGCSVWGWTLPNDPDFAAAVAREAGLIVPEYELKPEVVFRNGRTPDFTEPDAIAAFAAAHGRRMRGHTLIWHDGLPRWLEDQLNTHPHEDLITAVIAPPMQHYAGRMQSWDVINEVVEPDEGDPSGLRVNSPWRRAYGDAYIAMALRAARRAGPSDMLVYNEYGLEMVSPWHESRRNAVRRLIERLRREGVPLDALGLQAHLSPFEDTFSEDVFASFLRDMQSLGLKILITELDAADSDGPADVAQRDAEVGRFTRRFLDVALANPAVIGVTTWGLSDRYSWMSAGSGGQRPRPLPLDDALRPKPLWAAIAQAFDACPRRA